MGCPMAKVVSNGDGSALMKDIPLAARIVEAVAHAVPVPVTKCRLGWDRGSINVVELAQAEAAGAQAIAVHGRTRTMLYSGVATGTPSGRSKPVSIPVIANGDVFPERRRCNAKSGLSGSHHAGPGSLWDPGFFREVAAALAWQATPPGHPWPAGLTQRWSSFAWLSRLKGSTLPAWKRASTLPGTFGAYPTAAIIRENFPISTMADILDIAAGVKRDLR